MRPPSGRPTLSGSGPCCAVLLYQSRQSPFRTRGIMITEVQTVTETLGSPRRKHSRFGHFGLGRISLAILLVMTAGSVSFFFLIRSIVADQESRILHEHAGELALLLDESVQSDTTLLPLVATTSDAKLTKAFAQVAALLDDRGQASVDVFSLSGGHLRSVGHAG